MELKVTFKALAIPSIVSFPPTKREVPESTIPYFKLPKVYPATEIELKATGQ